MPRILNDFKSGVCRIEFDIELEEYYAIGRVTAQWAYLEHVVYSITAGISEAVEIKIPSDALSTSFKRRLKVLRLLVEDVAPNGEKARLIRLIDMIANAGQDRHKITHGLWEWDRENSDRISAFSFRPGFEFEKLFDAKRINTLADKIGEISFMLEYPDGWKSAVAEQANSFATEDGRAAFFHISRQLNREWTEKANQDQSPSGPATPPESKPPQPS